MSEKQPLTVCRESQEAEVLRRRAQVAEQTARIAQPLRRVQEREARLA